MSKPIAFFSHLQHSLGRLASLYGLSLLSLLMLLAFVAFFYFDAQFKHHAATLRQLSLNAERILNANDATASAIRLTAGLRSERYLFNYHDLLETRNQLLAESLQLVSHHEAKRALKDMAQAGQEIEILEKEALRLIEQEAWDAALALITSPHYKRQKGLYRANLSRALSLLVEDSEANTRQSENLAKAMQVTIVLVFLVFIAMGRLHAKRIARALDTERNLKQSLSEANTSLEQRVQQRTEQLSKQTNELHEAYEVISASIRYASRIQRAVLPDEQAISRDFPQHFVLWKPRDVVGGDIFWYRTWGNGVLIILGDCTGHGVPGAFMTLISTGALERACMEIPAGEVGTLLTRMHQHLQTTLGQHLPSGESDDGIELGACYLPADLRIMRFAGAHLSLFVQQQGEVIEVKGSRTSMGYRGIHYQQSYAVHDIALQPKMRFYLTSDGLIEQVNDAQPRVCMFGKTRFKALLNSLQDTPMTEQGDVLYQALEHYQGTQSRRDDVSIVGFEIPEHFPSDRFSLS